MGSAASARRGGASNEIEDVRKREVVQAQRVERSNDKLESELRFAYEYARERRATGFDSLLSYNHREEKSNVRRQKCSSTWKTDREGSFLKNHNVVILSVSVAIRKRIRKIGLSQMKLPPEFLCFVDQDPTAKEELPSLNRICGFLSAIHYDAKLETEVLVYGFILLASFLHKCKKIESCELELSPMTWRPIVFICMMIASKIHDDLSMINGNFGYVMRNRHLSLTQINAMEELAVVNVFCFKLRCTMSAFDSFIRAFVLMHNFLVAEFREQQVEDKCVESISMSKRSSNSYLWPMPMDTSHKVESKGDTAVPSHFQSRDLPH
eukprot:g280.t1